MMILWLSLRFLEAGVSAKVEEIVLCLLCFSIEFLTESSRLILL